MDGPANQDQFPRAVAERVTALCRRFEAACQAGAAPKIQDYLDETPAPEHALLLRRLLILQWSYAKDTGTPSLDEYLSTFPQHQELVRSLFAELQGDGATATGGHATIDLPKADKLPQGAPAIAGYEILEELGHGGMGIVYRARQLKPKRLVAIKVLMPALAANPTARKRFVREAQAMAAIEHEHVVTIYHVGAEGGLPYLAMQLLHGETLHRRLERDQRLPWQDVVRMGREIADGLSAAHQAGLVHRDIKPGNLWLQEGGDQPAVKILDFGLARAVTANTQLSERGAVVGTPQYMSPEQARGAEVDARSDLFSLGAVLYRAATGALPFRGNNIFAADAQGLLGGAQAKTTG